MKSSELKQIIHEAINEVTQELQQKNEAIGLGVAESWPEKFPSGIRSKLEKQYGADNPKAIATAWKISKLKESGDKRVSEMWMAWEAKGMKEAAGRNINESIIVENQSMPGAVASIDNNVFPLDAAEIEQIANQYQVKMRYVGEAQNGTENLSAYRIKFYTPHQGQLDALIDRLAQEKGIKFYEVPMNMKEVEDDSAHTDHDETNMSNPEEVTEVKIAKEMKALVDELLSIHGVVDDEESEEGEEAPEATDVAPPVEAVNEDESDAHAPEAQSPEQNAERDAENAEESQEVKIARKLKGLAEKLLNMHGADLEAPTSAPKADKETPVPSPNALQEKRSKK